MHVMVVVEDVDLAAVEVILQEVEAEEEIKEIVRLIMGNKIKIVHVPT